MPRPGIVLLAPQRLCWQVIGWLVTIHIIFSVCLLILFITMAHKFANLGVPVGGVAFPSVSPILRGESLVDDVGKKPIGGGSNRGRSGIAEDFGFPGVDSRMGEEAVSERFDVLAGSNRDTGKGVRMGGQSSFANLNVLRELSSQIEALFSRFTDIQNFLSQFDHIVVWNRFVDGKIFGVPPADLVESFRNLRTAIAPGAIRPSASAFLTKLLLGCSSIPLEIGGAQLPGMYFSRIFVLAIIGNLRSILFERGFSKEKVFFLKAIK